MAEYNKTKSHQIRKSDIQEITCLRTAVLPQIRAAAGQIVYCFLLNCIVVPPPQNIMEVKKKNYRGQNRESAAMVWMMDYYLSK